MAGDDQMDPQYLPALMDPIADRGYGFAKANRFFDEASPACPDIACSATWC